MYQNLSFFQRILLTSASSFFTVHFHINPTDLKSDETYSIEFRSQLCSPYTLTSVSVKLNQSLGKADSFATTSKEQKILPHFAFCSELFIHFAVINESHLNNSVIFDTTELSISNLCSAYSNYHTFIITPKQLQSYQTIEKYLKTIQYLTYLGMRNAIAFLLNPAQTKYKTYYLKISTWKDYPNKNLHQADF